jgi:uncharacterized protein (TIGR02996 family)
MSEENAFIQAVLADPDDDTVRLVFADWLEERGDPRAEFIRVQCELAKLTADRERAALISLGYPLLAEHAGVPGALVRDWLVRNDYYRIQRAHTDFIHLPENEKRLSLRIQELLSEHQMTWVGPIRNWVVSETYRMMGDEHDRGPRWQFRRGFLESVIMEPAVFLTVAEHLFPLAPIQEVTFLYPRGDLSALMASPWLENLKKMTYTDEELRGHSLGPGNIQVLAASPYLSRLVILELYAQGIRDAGVQALAAAPSLKHLAVLELGRNGIGDVGVQALAASPNCAGLLALHLGENDIGDSGVRALADSPYLTHLASLDLGFNRRISEASAQAILSSPRLSHLTKLRMPCTRIGEARRQALRAHFRDDLD